jgi:seryl-tRNA synthetase
VIDPRLLRDDPDLIRAAQGKRGLSSSVVDDALEADSARRAAIADFEHLRAEQKQLGKLIARAQGEEKADLLARTKRLAADVKVAEATQAEAEQHWHDAIYAIPNPAADAAPAGGEEDYVVLSEHGTPRDFKAEGFAPRDHVELGRILGAIDVERGAKVSGARFYYLTGAGADLELALVMMAMDQARSAGFTTMIPPTLVKPRAMEGTGFLGQAADDVYRIEGQDTYLVGGPARGVPLRRDPGRELAAAPLRGVQPVLPQGGRLLRQGHPGHLPRALVRQGGDVLLHHPRGGRRRARAAAGLGAGVAGEARAPLPRDRRRGR